MFRSPTNTISGSLLTGVFGNIQKGEHPETRTLMIDARPANILVDRTGKLFPIDVMLKTASDAMVAATGTTK